MQAILVSTNPDERDILSFILKHAGLAVAHGRDLHTVTQKWLEHPADLIVVAGKDGRHPPHTLVNDLLELRAVTQVPCLVIAEQPGEEELCQALHAGADLVLVRPVAPRLLHEYVLVLLRRNRPLSGFTLPRIDVSAVQLDPDSRTVFVTGQEPRRLTQLEFRLLYILMVNREQVVPVDLIVERVWGYTGQGSRELVRGLISRLRRKIEPDAAVPRFIHNVPGVGYRFSLEEV